MATTRFTHVFVQSVPERLDEGVLYVSLPFTTALHLCACGCGSEVVTPLSPRSWSMTFDGESVSLRPSIGNWNFPCRSHYWIGSEGLVRWARTWSTEEVKRARAGEAIDRVQRGADPVSGTRLIQILRRWFRRPRLGGPSS